MHCMQMQNWIFVIDFFNESDIFVKFAIKGNMLHSRGRLQNRPDVLNYTFEDTLPAQNKKPHEQWKIQL